LIKAVLGLGRSRPGAFVIAGTRFLGVVRLGWRRWTTIGSERLRFRLEIRLRLRVRRARARIVVER
jgi:hypothetical protein